MPTPDLAFSGAGNVNDAWTVQMLVNTTTNVNEGYDTKAPTEDKDEKNGQ